MKGAQDQVNQDPTFISCSLCAQNFINVFHILSHLIFQKCYEVKYYYRRGNRHERLRNLPDTTQEGNRGRGFELTQPSDLEPMLSACTPWPYHMQPHSFCLKNELACWSNSFLPRKEEGKPLSIRPPLLPHLCSPPNPSMTHCGELLLFYF